MSWHMPVSHDRTECPHSRHALVAMQPVSMALPVALVQRRGAARRRATAGLPASRSWTTCHVVVLFFFFQEALQMLQCRSHSPGSYRLLIVLSGVCAREVQWQPK